MLSMVNPTDLKQHALSLAQQQWGGHVDAGRLMPISDLLGDLVDDGKRSCSVAGSWRPVVAEPKQQERAVNEIASRGLPAYCPYIWVAEKPRRGEIRAAKKSMFGPYIFAKWENTEENFHKVTGARGVQRVLKTASGHVGVVDDDAMTIIRAREAETARYFEDQRRRLGLTGIIWDFEPGETARVTSGPFAGFNVELTSAVDEQGRIAALVNLFGRKSKTTFHASDLEKL